MTLVTRRAGEGHGTRWESRRRRHVHAWSDGRATRRRAPRSRCTSSRPTTEDELHDYTAEWTIREIVKRYSDFIT